MLYHLTYVKRQVRAGGVGSPMLEHASLGGAAAPMYIQTYLRKNMPTLLGM